jgi:hypothetical protein
MTEQFDIGDLVDIPSSSITEEIADKYNGTKTKVAKVYVGEKTTAWKDGVKLPDGQTVVVPVVFVETEVFGKDAKDQPLFKKEAFGLKKVGNKVGFSDHKKAKGRRFMKMLKINKIEEAIGKEVLIVKSVFGAANDRFDLVFSIPA